MVEPLSNEFRKVVLLLFAPAAVALVFGINNLAPLLLAAKIPPWLATAVAGTSIYGTIFGVGLWLYNKTIWYLLPSNRRHDYRGTWQYVNRIERNGKIEVENSGTARIEQTALEIRFTGESDLTRAWNSTCVFIDKNGDGWFCHEGLEYDTPDPTSIAIGVVRFKTIRNTDSLPTKLECVSVQYLPASSTEKDRSHPGQVTFERVLKS